MTIEILTIEMSAFSQNMTCLFKDIRKYAEHLKISKNTLSNCVWGSVVKTGLIVWQANSVFPLNPLFPFHVSNSTSVSRDAHWLVKVNSFLQLFGRRRRRRHRGCFKSRQLQHRHESNSDQHLWSRCCLKMFWPQPDGKPTTEACCVCTTGERRRRQCATLHEIWYTSKINSRNGLNQNIEWQCKQRNLTHLYQSK